MTSTTTLYVVFGIWLSTLLWSGCQSTPEQNTDTQAPSLNTELYLEKGKNLALSSQLVLAKNLIEAIQKHGTAGAVTFCNERAIPLTDSMGNARQSTIQRISDRNRNPENKADAQALAYIQQAKSQLQTKGNITPKVFFENGHAIGYYPILTNAMCLQCHGDVQKDVNLETQTRIAQLYPSDKATGYNVNELRGIWRVKMALEAEGK